jgi:hypothetical protein
MKKNWNKQKDKFNKKLNSIFFCDLFKKKRYIYIYIYIYIKKNVFNVSDLIFTGGKCHVLLFLEQGILSEMFYLKLLKKVIRDIYWREAHYHLTNDVSFAFLDLYCCVILYVYHLNINYFILY